MQEDGYGKREGWGKRTLALLESAVTVEMLPTTTAMGLAVSVFPLPATEV